MIDLIQEILATIRRNKLRTSLTGFAVAWGIFMLIVLLGAGNGLIHAFEHQAANMKSTTIKIYPGMTAEPFMGMNEGRKISFHTRDQHLPANRFSTNVVEVGAVCSKADAILTYGKENVTITINGVLPNYPNLEAVRLLKGRFINKSDIEHCRKVLILHEKTARILFPHDEPIAKDLQVQGVVYKVVGIYTDQNSFSPSALAPLSTIQKVYHRGDTIDNLAFATQNLPDKEANEQFEAAYRASMGQQKHFAPKDKGAIWIWNRVKQNLQQQTAAKLLHIAIWVIGIFTLLSGIVGVSNIMLITVRERTHEFGIRKALGARPSSILWLIISESVAITTFFGYIGMVAGVAVTEYMNMVAGEKTVDAGAFSVMVFQNPTVDLSIAIQATITLIIAGTLAGFFPARKAAQIRPIEALRAD